MLLRGQLCAIHLKTLFYTLLCRMSKVDAGSLNPVFSCSSLKHDSLWDVPVGSTVAFVTALICHMSSAFPGMHGAAGGRQPAAATPLPCKNIYVTKDATIPVFPGASRPLVSLLYWC